MVDVAQRKVRVAIVGIVGLPAAYSGFETLAENLVRYNEQQGSPIAFTVYCSSLAFKDKPQTYHGAKLRYLPINPNNTASIIYDSLSILLAVASGVDVIIMLGLSGAISLPLLRLFSRVRIITNVDGIEWRREKWTGIAKQVLRISERLAVRWSHQVIADNKGISDHVQALYGTSSAIIAYGGDHALSAPGLPYPGLPEDYALALCRIEPENNVHMILEAFENGPIPLVFVGNWDRSEYGRDLKQLYAHAPSIKLIDPIYDLGTLRTIRQSAVLYIHGHSAGGTNPSLVEMMHFGVPIFAYNCVFNRETTENQAIYFSDSQQLRTRVEKFLHHPNKLIGEHMLEQAKRRYTWHVVGKAYLDLLSREAA